MKTFKVKVNSGAANRYEDVYGREYIKDGVYHVTVKFDGPLPAEAVGFTGDNGLAASIEAFIENTLNQYLARHGYTQEATT